MSLPLSEARPAVKDRAAARGAPFSASPPVCADRVRAGVHFRVLGRVEVIVDGHDVAPTAPRALQLLALMLLNAGRTVPTDAIVAELWGTDPPRRARSAVQTHIYQLRQCMAAVGVAEEPEKVLLTRAPGYMLEVDPARLDLHAFLVGVRCGLTLLSDGLVEDAAWQLRQAEELWAGPPLANVACGDVLSAESVELIEHRRGARAARIAADIDSGRHQDTVAELQALCLSHPLDEVLHSHLIRALGRCGRRSDAMSTYRRLRDVLDTELGVEPGDGPREAYAELLTHRTAGAA